MALNAATITTAVTSALKTAYNTELINGTFSDPPTDTEIEDAMAAFVAAVVTPIIDAIKTDADLTGVTAGSDTVAGGVD